MAIVVIPENIKEIPFLTSYKLNLEYGEKGWSVQRLDNTCGGENLDAVLKAAKNGERIIFLKHTISQKQQCAGFSDWLSSKFPGQVWVI